MARPPIVDRLIAAGRWTLMRLRSKRLRRISLAAVAVGVLAIGYEASFRARLGPPLGRLPTTLYTRPITWPRSSERTDPLPIGPIRDDLSEYRVPVRLASVPDHLIQAVLAVEDQRFDRHRGLDFRRIAGAAVANLKHGGIAQGGSTITQQLAKNLFLSHRRTPLRKLREAAMALALEDRYDKATILEAYLNEIYLGQDGGDAIHGVGAAARYYFGKPAGEVTLSEAALLAGMIRAPNRYTPIRHPAAARERRNLVLRLMASQGRATERDTRRAARARIATRSYPRRAVEAPYFRDFALAGLRGPLAGLGARGGAVFTTLDAELQRAANRAVSEGLARLRRPAAQAALVALDPRTGELLALVGGRDYGASQFNRAADARRQPGSAFKPVVALAGLGRGRGGEPRFTLASVIRDEPLSLETPAGRWEPSNYDREFRGRVTFREALEQSLNVPFARIGLAVGPERIVGVARTLGFTSPLRPLPSLALGTSEVTPLELTRAYGVLAAGGYRAEPLSVLALADRDGRVRRTESRRGTQVIDPAEAYLVTSALEGVILRGTGRGLGGLAGWGGLAGKSGTSNEWRDAWFVAYTPSLVVGVWVGHDDGRSLRLPGAGAALPIVERFLRVALDRAAAEPFPIPDGIEMARTRSEGYGWVDWNCGRPEVFLAGTAPENECRGFEFLDDLIERLSERMR